MRSHWFRVFMAFVFAWNLWLRHIELETSTGLKPQSSEWELSDSFDTRAACELSKRRSIHDIIKLQIKEITQLSPSEVKFNFKEISGDVSLWRLGCFPAEIDPRPRK